MGKLTFQANLGGSVNLVGPNTASTVNLTLPTSVGTSGQPLLTDGTGNLSFGTLTPAGGGTGLTALGTGVATALGTNVGTAGAFVVNGGALGAPSSGTATNLTGLPLSTGVTGTLATTNGGTGLTSFTANGVLYASGTGTLATGSALTFDGTTLGVTSGSSTVPALKLYGAAVSQGQLQFSSTAGYGIAGGPDYTGLVYNVGSSSYQHIWQINSAEQMRLTSTGLGIGTSSPAAKLHVSGSAAKLYVDLGGNNYYQASNQIWQNYGGGTEYMRLDSSGNLGLGVTPSASTLRMIQGPNAEFVFSGVYPYIAANTYYNSGWKYQTSAAASYYVQATGQHQFFTAPSGTAGTAISFTQAMTLDASGRLLVGLTSNSSSGPVQALVNGTGTSFQTNPAVFGAITSTVGREVPMIYGTDGTNTALVSMLSGNMAFFTQATERARIDSSGNLLVGTTSNGGTNAKFEVDYAGSYGAALVNTNNTSGTNFLAFYNSTFGSCGSISRVTTTNAVTYNTTSDYRLKTLIAPVIDSGTRLDALNPVEYEWNETGHRARGFFAHEFQQVYADSVTGEKDAVDEDGKPIYQAMQASTAEVIADLVAEIQSLRKRLAALEAK